MSEGIRLNKYLSESGICSRRQADKLIENGEITIDGVVAQVGAKVPEGAKVKYKNRIVRLNSNIVIYAYNKPAGQVCTSKDADKDSIFNYVEFPEKVNYVGRLDKDSQGLLLLTNDGDLANNIQKAKNNHEKEYQVRVSKDITEEFLEGLRNGVPILDTITKPCKVTKTAARTFKIVLTQGLNRQIRRMCDYFGYRVVYLKRNRILNIKLDGIKTGQYRQLTESEELKLRALVSNVNEEDS